MPGNNLSMRELCLEWRLAARCAPPGVDERVVALAGRWRLAVSGYRQAIWDDFA